MRHIKEIFNHKDLSFIDDEYDNFLQKKETYLQYIRAELKEGLIE